jgi:endo-1,3(4)-beta-glucanase
VDSVLAYSTTHGPLQAFTSTSLKWTMKETQSAPTGFYPSSTIDSATATSQGLLTLLRADIDADWSIPLDGGYYGNGKLALKYASLCLMANDPVVAASNTTILSLCLGKLRTVMEPFASNGWTNKLVYDQVYGGVISSSGITTNDRDADYGNSIYNDHHFQYGYWLHAAAIVNQLDPTWTKLAAMNTMTGLLARDYANFATGDTYFPRFRSFDWFLGHSYAHGLTSMADGKDEESSSEDVNSAFALYMYGKTTGNAQMEAVGKLMTRVNAHAIQSYYLLLDSNTNHPASYRANKVASMIFDGKVNYGTWFSADKTAIHGIQMLPVSAVTPFVRTRQFVSEEWTQILSKVGMVTGSVTADGWLSILYLNYAAVDKATAMSALQTAPLDDGLSRSWAIYMAASYAN